jgi:prolipoprotein diacylglyceryltransferase
MLYIARCRCIGVFLMCYPGVLYEIFVNMVVMTVILIILSYIFHYIFLDTSAGGVLISRLPTTQ